MEQTRPTKKKKPVRAYSMQRLQEIVANPDQHPERLVELCRREIDIREKSRKYRKEVEGYSDDQIDEILAIPGANPAPLVYRCQVERRKRAKAGTALAANDPQNPESSGTSGSSTSKKVTPFQQIHMGLIYIAACGVIVLIPGIGDICGLILLIMGYVCVIKGLRAMSRTAEGDGQQQEACETLRKWSIASLVACLFPVAGTIVAIAALLKNKNTLSNR